MLYENNHGDTDEGGRMMDEKEETSIIVFDQFQTEFDQIHPSSLILHPFLRVFVFNFLLFR